MGWLSKRVFIEIVIFIGIAVGIFYASFVFSGFAWNVWINDLPARIVFTICLSVFSRVSFSVFKYVSQSAAVIKDFEIIIYLTVAVLLLLYLLLKFDVNRWFDEIPSHLFMALLIAFLGLVLYRAEQLRDEITDHRKSLKTSEDSLKQYGQALVTARENFAHATDTLSTTMERLGRLADHTGSIHDLALKSVNPKAYETLLVHSAKLTSAWAKLLLKEDNHSELPFVRSLQYLNSKCLQLMYESYIDEEMVDLCNNGELPVVTTNYPTYLEFIKKLSTTFMDDVRNMENPVFRNELNSYKVCFIAIANNLPVEWLMLCRKISENVWECMVDEAERLSEWRDVSSQLADFPETDSFFRRIFITADFSQEGLNVPSFRIFKDFLSLYIWYPLVDKNLKAGFPGDVADEFLSKLGIKKSRYIEFNREKRLFFISPTNEIAHGHQKFVNDSTGKQHTLNEPPMTLKEFLLQKVHKGNEDTLRLLNFKNHADLVNNGFQDEFPMDMFTVGIMPSNSMDPKDIEPILGIACLYNDLSQNVSLLRLYSREQLVDKPIWNWIIKLADAPKLTDIIG